MNIAIDIGNSSIKVGIFKENLLEQKKIISSTSELQSLIPGNAENVILSSVKGNANDILSQIPVSGKKLVLSTNLPLPVSNKYATPATLGVDRIAAACGALQLFPHENCLIIDAGTCINYEFINDKGEYLGGAISPGIRMRFEAMHHFTAKLPMAEVASDVALTGNSTISCLQSGVMNGALEEIKGIMNRYQTGYPGMRVILCGGDAHFFENHLNPSIFVAPDLVLMGLNSILLYNVTS